MALAGLFLAVVPVVSCESFSRHEAEHYEADIGSRVFLAKPSFLKGNHVAFVCFFLRSSLIPCPLSLASYPFHPFLSGQLLQEVKATQQAMIGSRQLQPSNQLECIAVWSLMFFVHSMMRPSSLTTYILIYIIWWYSLRACGRAASAAHAYVRTSLDYIGLLLPGPAGWQHALPVRLWRKCVKGSKDNYKCFLSPWRWFDRIIEKVRDWLDRRANPSGNVQFPMTNDKLMSKSQCPIGNWLLVINWIFEIGNWSFSFPWGLEIPLAICSNAGYNLPVRVEVNAFVVYIHLYVARNSPKALSLGIFV